MNFESTIILHDMSNHMPLLTLLKQMKVTDKSNLVFKSRKLNDTKLNIIKIKLYAIDWIGKLKFGSCSENFDDSNRKVNQVMDEVSPVKDIIISHNCKFVEPWMTRGFELSSKI